VGVGTESSDTPAYIFFGVDISSSAETLYFFLERKELIRLINLNENFNLGNLRVYNKPMYHFVTKAFQYPRIVLLLLCYYTWYVSLIH
jgi:hypothetical protein